MDWIAPTLSLAGVVAAAGITLVASRRTARDARRSKFYEQRVVALEELVERLNGLEFDLRAGQNPPPVAELEAQLGPLNMFLKNRQELLRDDEAQAARRKLAGLIALAEKYAGTTHEERASMLTTTPHPVVNDVLADAFRTFVEVDRMFAERLRAAQGGPKRL